MDRVILNEKYRPLDWGDFINVPENIKELTEKQSLPNLLFIGRAGIGKTTLARIIARKVGGSFMELNASDERGIDVIRNKVKIFSMKKGINILLLDEADGLTYDAQHSMRRIMEIYKNTIFILTANFISKIIEPIRSRCQVIEFLLPERKQVLDRLIYICEKEGVNYTEDKLNKIMDYTYPDIRKSINLLQLSVSDNEIVIKDLIFQGDTNLLIWELFKKHKFKSLRKFISMYPIDYDNLYVFLFNVIFDSGDFFDDEKRKMLLLVSDRMYKNSFVSSRQINLMACYLELANYLKGYE